jgi:hypothetical protein
MTGMARRRTLTGVADWIEASIILPDVVPEPGPLRPNLTRFDESNFCSNQRPEKYNATTERQACRSKQLIDF